MCRVPCLSTVVDTLPSLSPLTLTRQQHYGRNALPAVSESGIPSLSGLIEPSSSIQRVEILEGR